MPDERTGAHGQAAWHASAALPKVRAQYPGAAMMLPQPHEWQEAELRLSPVPKRALWVSPRLGKTYAAALMLRGHFDNGLRRAVITAPKRVLPIWAEWLQGCGLPTLQGYELPVSEVAARLKEGAYDSGVLLLNDDRLADAGTARKPRKGLIEPLLRWRPGAYVCDESHRITTPSTGRGRAARKLSWATPWVRQLTGTPVANHLGNVWGQLVALDQAGFGTYGRFRSRYLIVNAMFPSQVLGYNNLDELRALMLPLVSVVRREDVFGPDQWQYVDRFMDFPPEVHKLYETLAHEWLIDEPRIEATNVLARLKRFQQMTSGFLPDKAMGIERALHTVKLDMLAADLEEIIASGEKTVIYYRFRWEGRQVAHRLRAMGIPFVEVNGDTNVADSHAAQDTFLNAPSGYAAVVQIEAGGEGLSFKEATHAQFLSTTFSFIKYEQGRDRIYKPGARRCVTHYRIRNSVDDLIFDTIARKQDLHQVIRNVDRARILFGKKHH